MRITKVELHNFMRYAQAEVNLDQGFNAIVGQTDAGKSTLLRALIWTCYNRPSGIEMIRAGSDECWVTIWTDTGILIRRYRSKKRNAYWMDDTWYDTVGTGVPEPIQAALGIRVAQLGPKVFEMLNVSRQLDGPFMLDSSPADAAKILGQLSGITRIDSALASLRPDISQAKKDQDRTGKLERLYDASIGEFATLDRDITFLEEIGVRLAQASRVQLSIDQLQEIEGRMEAHNEILQNIEHELEQTRAIVNLREPLLAAQARSEHIVELRGVSGRMLLFNTESQEHTTQMAQAKQDLEMLLEQRRERLHELGQCPLCGART